MYVQISDRKHVISRIIVQICFMLIFTGFIHVQSFVYLTYSQSYSLRLLLVKGTANVKEKLRNHNFSMKLIHLFEPPLNFAFA